MSSTEHHLIVSSKNQLVSVRSEAGRKLVIRGLDILKKSASLAAFVQNEVIQEPRILKLRSLIDKGEIEDAFYLAEEICFDYGRSTASETREAMEAALKLAEEVSGFTDGSEGLPACRIATWYNMGKLPFPRDWEKSAQWAQLSADTGNRGGVGYLSWLYYIGRGVPQDYTLALKYALLSIEKGNSYTLKQVAESYQFGHGTTIDLVKAYAFYSFVSDSHIARCGTVSEQELEEITKFVKNFSIADRLRFQEVYDNLKKLIVI